LTRQRFFDYLPTADKNEILAGIDYPDFMYEYHKSVWESIVGKRNLEKLEDLTALAKLDPFFYGDILYKVDKNQYSLRYAHSRAKNHISHLGLPGYDLDTVRSKIRRTKRIIDIIQEFEN